MVLNPIPWDWGVQVQLHAEDTDPSGLKRKWVNGPRREQQPAGACAGPRVPEAIALAQVVSLEPSLLSAENSKVTEPPTRLCPAPGELPQPRLPGPQQGHPAWHSTQEGSPVCPAPRAWAQTLPLCSAARKNQMFPYYANFSLSSCGAEITICAGRRGGCTGRPRVREWGIRQRQPLLPAHGHAAAAPAPPSTLPDAPGGRTPSRPSLGFAQGRRGLGPF